MSRGGERLEAPARLGDGLNTPGGPYGRAGDRLGVPGDDRGANAPIPACRLGTAEVRMGDTLEAGDRFEVPGDSDRDANLIMPALGGGSAEAREGETLAAIGVAVPALC